jgi:hypothetical protein
MILTFKKNLVSKTLFPNILVLALESHRRDAISYVYIPRSYARLISGEGKNYSEPEPELDNYRYSDCVVF